LNASELRLQR